MICEEDEVDVDESSVAPELNLPEKKRANRKRSGLVELEVPGFVLPDEEGSENDVWARDSLPKSIYGYKKRVPLDQVSVEMRIRSSRLNWRGE